MVRYVRYEFDKDNDGYLSDKEIKAVHKLTGQGCDGKELFDFRGVELADICFENVKT